MQPKPSSAARSREDSARCARCGQTSRYHDDNGLCGLDPGPPYDDRKVREQSAATSTERRFRVRGGAWRHGWRWKVWTQIGAHVVAEAGLGRVWLNVGRLALTADRNGGQDGKTAIASISWRRRV